MNGVCRSIVIPHCFNAILTEALSMYKVRIELNMMICYLATRKTAYTFCN
jgi:hypothetical protein